ncbi:hypothetical protein, partial [Escherichia coli]|uniref:hypothetical protein n=1 Tax=Escherichia coli TaxID=562 RepID=UPI0023AF9E2E
ADRNRSHWSTSKTPSYTKSVSWHHHRVAINNRLRVVLIFLGIVPPVGFLFTTAYFNYLSVSGSACRSNITVNRV